MEGAIQHPHAQAAKPSKNKSKQTSSTVFQKTIVVKTTKTKNVRRVKVVISEGEGMLECIMSRISSQGRTETNIISSILYLYV